MRLRGRVLAAATWVWALVAIVVFFALGLLVMLALGLLELPGNLVRRAGHAAVGERAERGRPLPGEVPDRTPAEAADEADRLRGD